MEPESCQTGAAIAAKHNCPTKAQSAAGGRRLQRGNSAWVRPAEAQLGGSIRGNDNELRKSI